MRRSPIAILRDRSGTAIIEFALLAPMMFSLIFGIIQIGISMQAYNAMRSVASDTQRYALVEFEKKNEVADAAIETQAKSIAASDAYLLGSNFNATVTSVVTSRVFGAHEKTLTVTYTPPNLMPFFNWVSPQLSYSRPIFVIDE